MSEISARNWKRGYDKTVEIKFAETTWPVYETYKLEGPEGFRYVFAPPTKTEPFPKQTGSVDPLAPKHHGLFLEFARWFDKQKMDGGTDVGLGPTLDTPRNGEAALAWARKYGVLGLGTNPHESFSVGSGALSNSTDIAAERLGMPDLQVLGTRAYSKGRRGGKHETVEGFVFEAYQANVVLKLYEAATFEPVDLPAITQFMSKQLKSGYDHPGLDRTARSEWELYSGNRDDAHSWAIRIVEDTVTKKVEIDVYDILLGEPGSYTEARGFKSLLGAMWFQMRIYMLSEDNKCPQCGRVVPKTRRDKVYCDDGCGSKFRAARAYEDKKQHQQEVEAATRRRLQG